MKRAIGPLLLALAALPSVTARQDTPSAAEVTEVTAADLIGTWAGDLSHNGETTKFALHLEPGEEGKIIVKMSVPSVHVSETPVGRVTLRVEGDEIRLGPFSFTYDRSAGTLTGTMPESLVPVYRLPLLLRRVERFEVPSRPELSASIARPVWNLDVGASLWPGATFANGIVYAGGEDGELHAIEARTGKRRWSFRAGGPIRSRATIAAHDLYFQADDGFLYKLAAANGVERWRVRICDGPITRLPFSDPKSRYDRYGSDVAVAGGHIFVGTHDGHVLALNPRDGSRVWDFAAGDSVLAAPAIDGRRLYFGSYDHHVYALDAKTGRLLWKNDTGAPVVSTPALDHDRVVVGSRSYDLLGFDAKTGEPAWRRYFWFSWVESSARIRDGVAYVGSSDAAGLFAFDVRDGSRVWDTDVHGWAWGQPAVTADRVYIGTVGTKGYLAGHAGGALALERDTGRPVWRYAATAADDKPFGFSGSPAVGARLVFFTGLDGHVYAFAQ